MRILLLVPFWFVLALFIPTALWVTGAYRKVRGRRPVICPETGAGVTVELDACHAVAMRVLGNPVREIRSCDRWPARQRCSRKCLAQFEPAA